MRTARQDGNDIGRRLVLINGWAAIFFIINASFWSGYMYIDNKLSHLELTIYAVLLLMPAVFAARATVKAQKLVLKYQ